MNTPLDEELKKLDQHVSFNQNQIKEIENKILTRIDKVENNRIKNSILYLGSITTFALSIFAAFLIFSNPKETIERVSGEGLENRITNQVEHLLYIVIGFLLLSLIVFTVIRIRKRGISIKQLPFKFKASFIGIAIITLLVLWVSGLMNLWINGISYVTNNVDNYSVEAFPVDGEYSVTIDLSDLDSNKGKVLYDDGENQIYVSDVLVHNKSDYQIYFRSSGTYNLNGATLVSGIEHAYTQNGFTDYMHVIATATYRGDTFEIDQAAISGINYRDGDDFGFYLFPNEKDISVKEDSIIEVTLSNLVLNKWEKK